MSMEFLSLSRRRSSSRNVRQRRWARRNVCRSQAMPTKTLCREAKWSEGLQCQKKVESGQKSLRYRDCAGGQGKETIQNSFCWVWKSIRRVAWFQYQRWTVSVCLEKGFVPGEESLEDRRHIFHGHLYRAIKRKMWSSWREDPEVRIELPIEPDVFSYDLSRGTKSNFQIAETEKKLLNLLMNVKTKMRGKKDNQKVKWLTRSVDYLIVYLERKRGKIALPWCISPPLNPSDSSSVAVTKAAKLGSIASTKALSSMPILRWQSSTNRHKLDIKTRQIYCRFWIWP